MKKLLIVLLLLAPFLVGQTSKKIVAIGLTPEEIRDLQSVSSEVVIVSPSSTTSSRVTRITADEPGRAKQREELLRLVADADGFIGGPSREVIQAAKKLKWVQIPSAGVENYRYPELINSDIIMTNYKQVASPAIADHAMSMLLAFTRGLNQFIPARTEENWVRRAYELKELQSMTALVIGVGGIGSNVARRAWAAGMKVIGVDPKDLNPSPFVQELVFPDRLDSVIPQADVVFICTPHTPESEGMFGEKQFDLMKEGSYFIAVSRGKVYSMDGLIRSLKSGKLAAAGVDVTVPEPVPAGHPLWKFENVIITPHVATISQFERKRQMEVLRENVARFAKDEPMLHVVDKIKGY